MVIEHLDRRRGGAETYVHDFATYLLGQGHEVQILAQDVHEPPAGAEVHVVRPDRGLPWRKAVRFARAVRRKLGELRPDTSLATGKALGMGVYQPHGGTVRASQRQNAARLRSDAGRVLKLAVARSGPKHRAAWQLEADQFADPGTRFVAISRMVWRDMRTFYRVPEERMSLVYNGVDLERFHPARCREHREAARVRLGIPEGATVLLLVAHNPKLKGLREQIGALARLTREERQGLCLLVVGRGRTAPYQRLARRLNIAEAVIFAGPQEDMASVYGAADALVHPTWYDPCSLVALEALACGLPVLTTRLNGVSELMEGRGAGVILDSPRPITALAEGARGLLDPARREAMGRAARGVAEEHPVERNFREMLDLLARSAEGGEP